MILVKFNHNYADEYDVIGFKLMTIDQYEIMLDSVRETFVLSEGTVSCGWGGNDQIEFESYEEWHGGLMVTELSSDAFSIITDTIDSSFGHCLVPEY